MTLWRLVVGEIGHRRLNFLLGCVSVALAAGGVVGSAGLLRGHDLRTDRLVEEKEARTRQEMARMEDDYRRIMRRMGYNVLVIHRDQDIGELHTLGHPTVAMPEGHAHLLAGARLTTLNHLLPILQHRMVWPEIGREVVLTGVRGQVMTEGRSPIMPPVPQGHLVLGEVLAESLGARAGSTVALMGEEFRVDRVHAARGSADDMGVWVPLDKAQQWLDQPGRINGILALECVCEPDSLGRITAEVAGVLPEVRVLEFSSMVRSRAEARQRAAETHRKAVAAERVHRTSLRRERERLAGVLVPLGVGVAGLWVGLLAYGNARDRRGEIGILRAIGVGGGLILRAFLLKAALMGLLGGLAGLAGGAGLAWAALGEGLAGQWGRVLDPTALVVAVALGPVLACGAAWLPAMSAAQQDPAAVLREE